MESITFHLANPEYKLNAMTYIAQLPVGEKLSITIEKEKKTRTAKQNNSLHDYFGLLAEKFNDGGLDQKAVMAKIKEGVDIPWHKESIKESLWKPMQEFITGETSTTKLTTAQVNQVYEILNKWTAQTFGVSVEFPSNGEKL